MNARVYTERPDANDSVIWTTEKLLRTLEVTYNFKVPEIERAMLERVDNPAALCRKIIDWQNHHVAAPPAATLRYWALLIARKTPARVN